MPQRHRWNIGAALTAPMFHRCCPQAVAAGSAEQPSVNSRALRVVLDDAGEIDPDLMSSLSKTCRRWVFTVCGETNNRSAIPRLVHPAAAGGQASSAAATDSVQQRSQQLDPGVPADQRPGITRGDGHQKTLRHEVSQMTYATSRPGRLPFRLTRF
jgi:hypothetical protein